MKCPKCGYVSYAGLAQCKKCSYPFVKAASQGSSSFLAESLSLEGARSTPLPPSDLLPARSEDSPLAGAELTIQPTPLPETARAPVSSSPRNLAKTDRSRGDERSRGWREELSERVEKYRKRRARLQSDGDPEGNFELDFEAPDKPEDYRSLDDTLGTSEDKDSSFDLNIGDSTAARDEVGPSREILSSEELGDEMGQIDVAPAEAEEMSLGEPPENSPPMEILVGSPTETARAEEERANEIYLAPLGRRFMAGLTDALVLILGAGVFGIIFWRFCGRLSLVPLNIAVLGLVAIILIFGYFAAFTAISSSTPGLLLMGCEIRNLDGDYPTTGESFWRAFGVLVSLSALMLGFVWACADSDSLTWHDRMSGTVITLVHAAAISLA